MPLEMHSTRDIGKKSVVAACFRQQPICYDAYWLPACFVNNLPPEIRGSAAFPYGKRLQRLEFDIKYSLMSTYYALALKKMLGRIFFLTPRSSGARTEPFPDAKERNLTPRPTFLVYRVKVILQNRIAAFIVAGSHTSGDNGVADVEKYRAEPPDDC